jgi:agmatine/peptidylarginine deiminase
MSFTFNGWGKKFNAHLDNGVNNFLTDFNLLSTLINIDLVLEGGSIESNGNQFILSTTRCLLEPNRNPSMSLDEILNRLETVTGGHVFAFEHGYLSNDDTDGHIDTLIRFIDPKTIVYVEAPNDTNHPDHEELAKMKEELDGFCIRNQIKAIAIPYADYVKEDQRYPASYVNFLFVNGALLVPQYDLETDNLVLEQFRKLKPELEVIGVPSNNFILQGGALHCLSMQIH